tara:strand:- start:343 stop:519 length:177 start_codon:yes stop_codon:yes gene_type:complete
MKKSYGVMLKDGKSKDIIYVEAHHLEYVDNAAVFTSDLEVVAIFTDFSHVVTLKEESK